MTWTSKIRRLTLLGKTVRLHRAKLGIGLNKAAQDLGLDKAILSKIETGQRRATKAQVVALAKYLLLDQETLLVPWLAEKMAAAALNEKGALRALGHTQELLGLVTPDGMERYQKKGRVREIVQRHGSIQAAWLVIPGLKEARADHSDWKLLIQSQAREPEPAWRKELAMEVASTRIHILDSEGIKGALDGHAHAEVHQLR